MHDNDRRSVAHAPPVRGPRAAAAGRPGRPANPAGNAARARLRILAVFLPLTAVLYISCEALDPKGTDQVINTTAVAVQVLPIAASHSAQLYVSGTLSILALGALAVSYAAIAALVR